MYSIIKKIVLVIFAGAMMTSANGQTLNNILTKISNASGKNGETVSSVLDNLIGTKKVSATSLVGKWVYSKPAVAFESQNALSKVGGSVVSSKMETKLIGCPVLCSQKQTENTHYYC